MTVYFHGNFGLNRERMARILYEALRNPEARDKDLSKPFGYNAPFTARYRSWLHKTGMVKLGYPVRLTEMGEVVYKNDPGLKSLTTQWFLHYELTEDQDRAEAWHYFFHEFLPANNSFTKKDLLSGLTDKLRAHSEQHFGLGSKLNKVILRKVLECYTSDEALGGLKLITEKSGIYAFNNKIQKRGPWSSIEQISKDYQ